MTTERTKEGEKILNSFSLHLANLSSRGGKKEFAITLLLVWTCEEATAKKKRNYSKAKKQLQRARNFEIAQCLSWSILERWSIERRRGGDLLSFASHPSTAVCHLTSSQCMYEKWIAVKTLHTQPTQTTPKPNQNNNLGRHFSLSCFLTRFLDEILRILLLEMGMRGERWTKELWDVCAKAQRERRRKIKRTKTIEISNASFEFLWWGSFARDTRRFLDAFHTQLKLTDAPHFTSLSEVTQTSRLRWRGKVFISYADEISVRCAWSVHTKCFLSPSVSSDRSDDNERMQRCVLVV